MPNSRNVDERIVEMRLDNEEFEKGAKKTISTLEKLERALHIKSDASGFNEVTDSVSKFDADPMVSGLEKIKNGFSALEIVGMRVISNLTDSVYNFATRTIKSFTIDPIMQGMGKFGEKTTAVSTLTAQGYELEKVNKLMEDLNWFTDETSYNFTDMVGNIAKFTATGQDLDESVTAMEGIALWAAVSGQNATKASMAMYQLSQAMGKGALKYDDYKSIQNASMDTQEFRQQAAAAAVELGYLRKTAEDVWETTEKTVKSGQEFDLAGLYSSDALSRTAWFTSDVMMNVFNRYSKAVSAVQKFMDDNDIDTASLAMQEMEANGRQAAETYGITLDEAFRKLGYDLDEFSLKALKAGQNARTWGDVVDSVKDAVSTGWMTTFEHLFGDAETATQFWTDIANKFYEIFAEGGNTRNSILKMALGQGSGLQKGTTGVENLTNGWERFENRLESSGKSMEDFRKALLRVSDAAEVQAIENFNDIDDALRKGGVSAELFKKAMEELLGVTDDTLEETDKTAQHASHSLEEMREVAAGILRGDYGNGEERRKAIEEMGYDFELMQAMAGNLKWGGLLMSDEQLIDWMEQYYRFNHLSDRLGSNSFAEYLTDTAEAAEDAIEPIENFGDLYRAVVYGIEDTEDAMNGGEYFRGGILNLIDTFSDIQNAFRDGFSSVFGEPEDIARGIFKVVRAFYNFTNSMRLGEGTMAGLTTIFSFLLSIFKGAGTVFTFLARTGGHVLGLLSSVVDTVGSIIGKVGETKTLENFGKAFVTIFEALDIPLRLAFQHLSSIFDLFRRNVLPGFLDRFGGKLEEISANVLEMALRFRAFLASDKVTDKLSGAFAYLLSCLRAIRNGFQNFDFVGEFERIWNWIRHIFTGVKAEDSDTLLALEDLSAAAGTIGSMIGGNPEEVRSGIRTFFTTVKETIGEELSKIKFGDLVKVFRAGVFTVFILKITELVDQAKTLTKNITSIPEAIAGTIVKAGDVLTAFRKSIMADAYIKIAGAIAILAASLWLLSKIPRDDLTHAATVIALLMAVLSGVVKAMGGFGSKVGDKNYNIGNRLKVNVFNGLAAKLIGFAMALGAVVAALAVVRKMDPVTIATTFLGIVVLVGTIGLVIRELSKLPNYNAKGISLTLVAMAFSLQMLMLPLAEMALIAKSATSYFGALFGVIGLIAALAAVIWLFSKIDTNGKTDNILKMAGAMSLISLAIGLMILPLAALAVIPGNVMGKAFAAMLGISLIFGVMTAMLAHVGERDGSAGILKMAGSMLIIALAMNMMIPVLGALAGAIVILEKKYTWQSIKENLLPLGELAIILMGFAVAAVIFGAALDKIGSSVLKVGTSFLMISVGLLALGFSLEKLGEAFPKFIGGLIEVGASIRGNELNFIWGAAALAVLALSIGALVKAISGLFQLGNVGGKFKTVMSSIGQSAGGMFKSMGEKMMDNLPALFKIIGSVVVLAALYLLDIIPQITEIAVNAIILFFSSLASSIQKNRDQFVDSITSIVMTLIGVVKDVFHDLWDQMGPGEQLFASIAGMLFVANKVSGMLIGNDGKGGLAGAFSLFTKSTGESIEAMAVTSAASLSGLSSVLLPLAAIVGYSAWGLDNQQRILDREVSDRLGDTFEDTIEKYRRAQEAARQAQEDFDNLAFYGGDLTMAQQEMDARQSILLRYEKELAAYLGITTEELKAQIEAADGDISKIDIVQKKLEEAAEEAEDTSDSINHITKEDLFAQIKADAEDFYHSTMPSAAGEGGDTSASLFGDMFASWFTGEEGIRVLTDGGKDASNSFTDGLFEQMQLLMPDVGSDTTRGFVNSIVSHYSDLYNAGAWSYRTYESGYRDASGTRSPSREMSVMADYAVDGFIFQILSRAADLNSSGSGFADQFLSAVSGAMANVGAIADERFELMPTITPVIEDSALQGARQSQIDQLVIASGEQINTMRSLWNDYAVKASEVGGTIEYSLENSRMNDIVSGISSKVDELGQRIANMQVVLDSGLLVGGIAGSMDRQLGTISMRRGRGN